MTSIMNFANEPVDETGHLLRRIRLNPEVSDAFLTHYLKSNVLPNHLPLCRYALINKRAQNLLAKKVDNLCLEHFNFDTFAFHLTKISAPTIWVSVEKTVALLRLLYPQNVFYQTSADGSVSLTNELIQLLKGSVISLVLKNAYVSTMWESTVNSLMFLREFSDTVKELRCDPRFLGFEMVPKMKLQEYRPQVSDADLMEMDQRVPEGSRAGFETEILRCTLRHNIDTLDLDADSKPFFSVDPRNPPIAPNHDLKTLKFHCSSAQTLRAFDFFRRFKCVAPNLETLDVEFGTKREFSTEISAKTYTFWLQIMNFVKEAQMQHFRIRASLCFVNDDEVELDWMRKVNKMLDGRVKVCREGLYYCDEFAEVELRVAESENSKMMPVEHEIQSEKDGFVY
ncbi:unnamed protein product [Bursaphelenchus okinawaensis]|uniref:Uncharacterized protein n=1 Tax=Bursaphelenchus okinawaensis TaxID=465554 RepID=A0A811LDV4_9BILA|nr:unnamed protein product [Bursaphelenchus okinawaensis]CAG9121265.1 unnamed protein product [Bursaphelenchus okinawaensis]